MLRHHQWTYDDNYSSSILYNWAFSLPSIYSGSIVIIRQNRNIIIGAASDLMLKFAAENNKNRMKMSIILLLKRKKQMVIRLKAKNKNLSKKMRTELNRSQSRCS